MVKRLYGAADDPGVASDASDDDGKELSEHALAMRERFKAR